jgi:hypothetical protein
MFILFIRVLNILLAKKKKKKEREREREREEKKEQTLDSQRF